MFHLLQLIPFFLIYDDVMLPLPGTYSVLVFTCMFFCLRVTAVPLSPGWAHVVCALYIPEVQFANVLTMEPIVLQYVPHERYNKVPYSCLI